jgi:serine/threonine protein phosphatase 1
MRIIIIGDIHGCYYTLLRLLKTVGYDKEKDTLVFLGDYIDRGKNGFEVVDYLIKLQKEVGKDKCICLLGNHEHMAMGGLYDLELWKQNGGTTTIKSYYRNNVPRNVHHWWFKQLPLMYETDDFVCCHAGLPETLIKDNDIEDMLWSRDWVQTKTEPNEKLVIFGHTPARGVAYKTPNGNICIDSACVFGYNLCALVYEGKDKYEFIYESKDEDD